MMSEQAERPWVSVGEFHLSTGVTEGRVWISHESGEGSDFDIEKLEAVIREFYDENF